MRLLAQLVVLLCLAGAVPLRVQAQKSKGSVALTIDARESTRLFSSAKERWSRVFRPKQLRARLQGLADGKEVSPELKQELYEARKSSAIIRSSFQLLDERHHKPKAIDRYVRAAGKLNDAINSGLPEKVPELASKVLQAMDVEAINKEVSGFRPSSAESFNGYLYTSLRFVERQSKRKSLKAPVYHQLRKELTNLLVLMNPKELTPAGKQLHDRLHKLRLDMGDVHDALVANKMTGAHYDKTRVHLTPMNRKDVKKVLRSLQVQRPTDPKQHYKRWRANIKAGRGASKAKPAAKLR